MKKEIKKKPETMREIKTLSKSVTDMQYLALNFKNEQGNKDVIASIRLTNP